MKGLSTLKENSIIDKIYIIRHCHVMFDSDLSELYQIETKNLNKAVKRNINRFPPRFMFQLTEEEWKNSFSSIFKHCIDVGYSQVPEKDYEFWVVAFHDENDETIFRRDSDVNEINGYFNDPDGYCKVWREFQTTIKPKYWVVWPYSTSKGWCERLTGNL